MFDLRIYNLTKTLYQNVRSQGEALMYDGRVPVMTLVPGGMSSPLTIMSLHIHSIKNIFNYKSKKYGLFNLLC